MPDAITILGPVTLDAPVVFFVGDEKVEYQHVDRANNPAASRPWSFVGQRLVGGIPFMMNPHYPPNRRGDPPGSR
jgi:hypothetical protein